MWVVVRHGGSLSDEVKGHNESDSSWLAWSLGTETYVMLLSNGISIFKKVFK